MHYLVTGHTGFKGSWLSLMLEMQGHTVSGIALNPPEVSLFNQANLAPIFHHDLRVDIRDRISIKQAIEKIDPEVIIHLAAQPLVRESYKIPAETFEINVIGTLNVLEATRGLKSLKAGLIITTDKVYKNHNHLRGYTESDELGGADPYSASKAAADIAAQSWIKSFAEVPFTIARAGNVIGGGDWASDRLIPDLVNAYLHKQRPTLRFPDAVRPWQNVLDCLGGYIKLIQKQLSDGIVGEWNFGPTEASIRTVREVVTEFAKLWQFEGNPFDIKEKTDLPESNLLILDSTKAMTQLGWKELISWESSLDMTFRYYISNPALHQNLLRKQISSYLDLSG